MRAIIALDFDCFYPSVVERNAPQLRGKPLGVTQKNIVVSANYAARARGVTGKLGLIRDAVRACPELVLVKGEDLTPFRAANDEVFELLAARPEIRAVEKLGLDEFFLDVTDAVRNTPQRGGGVVGHGVGAPADAEEEVLLEAASALAAELRTTIHDRTDLVVSAGIATSKMLAKIAAGIHKPNDQTTLFESAAIDTLRPLPLRKLPGVGHAARRALGPAVATVGDLAAMSMDELAALFPAATAARFYNLARGLDDEPVVQTGAPKSIAIEDAFQAMHTMDEVQMRLQRLARPLAKRLVADRARNERVAGRLALRYRFAKGGYACKMRSTAMPAGATGTDIHTVAGELSQAAISLFRKHVGSDFGAGINLVGISTTSFVPLSEAPPPQSIATLLRTPPPAAPPPPDAHLCERCGKAIAPAEAAEHADFHFAQDLAQEDRAAAAAAAAAAPPPPPPAKRRKPNPPSKQPKNQPNIKSFFGATP